MKTHYWYLLKFIPVLLIATSCSSPRYVYSPSAHNVPVLTQKGDNKIGAVYSTNFNAAEKRDGDVTDNRSRGVDVHGAVAITDHFAVQANYFYRWEKTTSKGDSLTVRYKRNLGELGIGYYIPLTQMKSVIFQVFAGVGLGRFSFTDNAKTGSDFHQANITKIYVQPAFLLRSKGSFTAAVSFRTTSINYSKVKTSYTSAELSDHNLDSLNNRAKLFFEPAFIGSFGFKNLPFLRLEFQGGLSFLTSRRIDYRIVNFSVGTWVNIGSLFKSKPE